MFDDIEGLTKIHFRHLVRESDEKETASKECSVAIDTYMSLRYLEPILTMEILIYLNFCNLVLPPNNQVRTLSNDCSSLILS